MRSYNGFWICSDNARAGKVLDVASEAVKIDGVKAACAVTGTVDVIATFEVENIADVGNVVVKGIQCIEGVCSTQTALCVKCCSK